MPEALRIKNFKSIKNLKLNCKLVNLFIGEPNSGKSNILEAIGVLSHMGHQTHIQEFVRFEVMTYLFYDGVLDDPVKIEFDEKGLQIEFKDGGFTGKYEHQVSPQQTQSMSLFHYGYSGGHTPSIHKDFRMFKFYKFKKLPAFPNQKSEFLQPPDGNNLLAVVMTRKRLRKILKEIFDKFGYRIVFRPQEGKIEIQKELEDILFSLPYSLASETLQRLVFYLAAIYSNSNSIITFEEPEAHAFPYYTKYLAERIALDKNNNQYFIATHNPYFLMSILEKTPNKKVAVFATRLENYETKVKSLTKKQKEEILEMGSDVFFNIKRFLS